MVDDVAVLEVGGTHVSAALVRPGDWEIQAGTLHRYPLVATAPAEQIVADLVAAADALGAPTGTRWGVATPGPFDLARGVALFRDVGKFDALYGLDLKAALSSGIRATPGAMAFIDDAEAFLVGEWLAGAARGARRCVGITLGTGVGSGFLADGILVRSGPDVPPSGRVHLLNINGLPLEDVVSRRAILRRYADLRGGQFRAAQLHVVDAHIDVKDVAATARAGEGEARTVLSAAFGQLGSALAPWLAAFSAEQLVIGGAMAASWDLVAPPLVAALVGGGAGQVAVEPGMHLETSPMIGAAWVATRPLTSPAPDAEDAR